MNLNFGIKDLLHHLQQAKNYFRINVAVMTLTLVFFNLIRILGLLVIPNSLSLYTITILEFFSDYNEFLVIMGIILTIFIVLINNHSIITSRKKDITVMKAVGAYPRNLYSFYVSELLIFVGLSFLVSYILAIILVYFGFIMLRTQFSNAFWQFNYLTGLIFGLGLLVFTFLINGWEIRRIGRRSFDESYTGYIKTNLNARIGKIWKKVFRRLSVNTTLAFKNMKRKKTLFQQSFVLIGLSSMILFTGILGAMVIDKTGTNYIQNAQGSNILLIGADPVISSYEQGYEAFRNPNHQINTLENLVSPSYNLTNIQNNIISILNTYGLTNSWEARLVSIKTLEEKKGYQIVNPDTLNESEQYLTIGQGDRNQTVPLVGLKFEDSTQHWYYEGSLANIEGGCMIGDTLAKEMFENAYQQKIGFYGADPEIEQIKGIRAVAVDSFNNGKAAYMDLQELQAALNLTNYVNLYMVNYQNISQSDLAQLMTDLNDLLIDVDGEDISILDLTEDFNQNIISLRKNFQITLILSVLISLFIIFIVFQYQQVQIEEDKRDLETMYMIGAQIQDVQNVIFIQHALSLSFGILLGLIGGLYFILLFLMEKAIFPSIWSPLLIFGALIVLFMGLSWINSRRMAKKYKKQFEIEIKQM